MNKNAVIVLLVVLLVLAVIFLPKWGNDKATETETTLVQEKETYDITTEKVTKENESEFLTADSSDIDELEEMINCLASSSIIFDGYDHSRDSYSDFLEEVFFDKDGEAGYSSLYSYFYDDVSFDGYKTSATPDPLKRFAFVDEYGVDGSYYEYDVDRINWISENVFSKQPGKFDDVGRDENYVHNGICYMLRGTGFGDSVTGVRITDCSQNSDGKYDVRIEVEIMGGYETFECRAEAALRNVDSQKIWTVYKLVSYYDKD